MWRHPALLWLYTQLSTSYQEIALRKSVGRSLQASGSETYDLARAIVQEASCSPLNASLEGELVHLTCPVTYGQPLGQSDPLLSGVPAEELYGFRLDAHMLVFQWDEFAYTRKVGKKSERDHLYFREWLERTPIRNTSFFGDGRECKVKNGGRPCYQWNPAEVEPWWNESGYELGWNTWEVAENVTVGDYTLPDEALLTMEVERPTTIQALCSSDDHDEADESNRQLHSGDFPCAPGNTARREDDFVVWQQMDSNGTMIDYLTRFYGMTTANTISVLAVQRGNSFVPWPENADNPLLFEFFPGTKSATQMIDAASASAVVPKMQLVVPWLIVVGSFLGVSVFVK